MTATSGEGRPNGERGRAGRVWTVTARRWLLWLHRTVGVAAGVMLSLTAATGSLLVFGEEIDKALNPGLLRVHPGETRIALDTVVDGVRATFRDRRIDRIHLADAADASLEVCFAEGAEPWCVYVDPYSGAHLGVRVPLHSFKGRIFSFHRRLFSGRTGEQTVGTLGILLIVLSLSGFILWRQGRRPVRPWRVPASTPYARRLKWHRALGLWAMPVLVLIAATGAAMAFRQTVEGALNRLASTSMPRPPSVAASGSGSGASLDAAVRFVMDVMPGATPTYLILPASSEAPIAVRVRMPGEWVPKGRSFAYLHPATGALLRADNALASPLGYRVGNGLYPLHIGVVGGLPLRLLQCLAGVVPAVLCWTGMLMWWRRIFPRRRTLERAAA